jgi:hypothetical protein
VELPSRARLRALSVVFVVIRMRSWCVQWTPPQPRRYRVVSMVCLSRPCQVLIRRRWEGRGRLLRLWFQRQIANPTTGGKADLKPPKMEMNSSAKAHAQKSKSPTKNLSKGDATGRGGCQVYRCRKHHFRPSTIIVGKVR